MMQVDTNGSVLSEKSVNGSKVKDAHSYVGFANFPNQVFRRAIKNGFEFTLMVVGMFSFIDHNRLKKENCIFLTKLVKIDDLIILVDEHRNFISFTLFFAIYNV